MSEARIHHVRTSTLDVGYLRRDADSTIPAILLHGFPYDVRAYDEVTRLLGAQGISVLVPYLRGYGPTRFRDDATPRSGQQGALGADLIEFMDAMDIDTAVVAGYDWGGRAACIAAATSPERVHGLVTVDGYNIQQLAAADEPAPPEVEATFWYQFYFHSERGRAGLSRNREALCALLWRQWSPRWSGAAEAFPASAPSLHNPDFVDVVIHSYRHRYGLAEGDPRYAELEAQLAGEPPITVPTVVLECGADGCGGPSDIAAERDLFTGPFTHTVLPDTGHNTPQESPAEFAAAVAGLYR